MEVGDDAPSTHPESVDGGYLFDEVVFDTLISLHESDNEADRPSRTAPELDERDLRSVSLVQGMKFASTASFRAIVKKENIKMGKDVRFKKNSDNRVVMVCKTEKCKYRVYGGMIPKERIFQIRDIQPRHKCPRWYRLSQVSFQWNTDKMVDQIKSQPNMAVSAIYDEGLLPAFEVVIQMVDHRFYVKHLYANFRGVGHRGVVLKDKLWGAATTYTENEFNKKMDELKALSLDAHEYLRKVDPSVWSRSWLHTHSSSDIVVNNFRECFNSYVLDARGKQICKKLMRRYQLKRDGIHTYTGRICQREIEKLETACEEASYCLPTYAGEG
ncbi:hypothetical protein CJ030_MR7G006000 [Morella rubra]|uniref:Transposase MuDR plant domain-containing protein n=1 Tax=Morella rubra TaxID=262757 RepID=A0A6A1V1C5_9ROSI|nr:hypothetical protein CJ030_MR7G006000 [Morella rubra]